MTPGELSPVSAESSSAGTGGTARGVAGWRCPHLPRGVHSSSSSSSLDTC